MNKTISFYRRFLPLLLILTLNACSRASHVPSAASTATSASTSQPTIPSAGLRENLPMITSINDDNQFDSLIPKAYLASFIHQNFPTANLPIVQVIDAPYINALSTYRDGVPVIVITNRTIRFILATASWGAYTWSIAMHPPDDPSRPDPLPRRVEGESDVEYDKRFQKSIKEWQNYFHNRTENQRHQENVWGGQMESRRDAKNLYLAYVGFAEAFQKNEIPEDPPAVSPEEQSDYDKIRSELIEGELGFVLGHEMGHIVNGDLDYAAMSLKLQPSQLLNVNMDEVLNKLAVLERQRMMETNADNVAIRFVERIGNHADLVVDGAFWAKAGMEEFIHLMENQEAFESATNQSDTELLRDHPYWKDRWINACHQGGQWWFILEGMRSGTCEEVQQNQLVRFEEALRQLSHK